MFISTLASRTSDSTLIINVPTGARRLGDTAVPPVKLMKSSDASAMAIIGGSVTVSFRARITLTASGFLWVIETMMPGRFDGRASFVTILVIPPGPSAVTAKFAANVSSSVALISLPSALLNTTKLSSTAPPRTRVNEAPERTPPAAVSAAIVVVRLPDVKAGVANTMFCSVNNTS